MTRILPYLIAGLDQFRQHINAELIFIIAENRRERIPAGNNVLGRKPGESQRTDIGYTALAFADIVLL